MLAYGRDPYFAGWPDTLQLDYSNPATQEAMRGELLRIAGQCDGVRCDMAMLVLPDVFERTWGRRAPLFWPDTTARVRERVPEFRFMAEVYWDLESDHAAAGLRLRLRQAPLRSAARGPRQTGARAFFAGLDYQDRLARFLENHDEPRAAATFPPQMHQAAAIVTYLSPGLRFFHDGQFEGRRTRISPHLVRAPIEPTDGTLQRFYERLLAALGDMTVRDGAWRLVECVPAWDGNWTADCYPRVDLDRTTRRAAPRGGQLRREPEPVLRPPAGPWPRRRQLQGCDGRARLRSGRPGFDARGLYLDMPPWGYHVFEVTAG